MLLNISLVIAVPSSCYIPLSALSSSYLSRISRFISVGKKMSCGEISDFCKELEQFMKFYRNLCPFCSKFVWRKICVEKISAEKKWQIWGLSETTKHPRTYDHIIVFQNTVVIVVLPNLMQMLCRPYSCNSIFLGTLWNGGISEIVMRASQQMWFPTWEWIPN